MNQETIVKLLKTTYRDWKEDNAARLAAALAYYTTFSLGPTIVIVIFIANLLGRGTAVYNQIMGQMENLLGFEGRLFIEGMIKSPSQPGSGSIATILGTATLLFGALGVFGELQNSLNIIWNVQPKPLKGLKANLKRLLMRRVLSFTMIVGIGFVLLVSLIINALLATFEEYLAFIMPQPPIILQLVNFVVSFGVITLLFALMFKILPDATTAWKDVWVGGAITSLLFSIGKVLISEYLGRTTFQSSFGAAGTLVVILVWIYYSAQILFLGAEFTQVYASCCGTKIKPEGDAVFLSERVRAQPYPPRQFAERLGEKSYRMLVDR
jgi:membrane protein